MGFFDSVPPAPPEPEPPAPPRPAWVKPDTTVGGSVALDLLLARSGDAAIALSGLVAYPHGFSFTIVTILREADHRGRLNHHDFYPGDAGAPPPEFLRVGLRFADGRVVSNLAGHPRIDSETPDRPLLLPDSGGGGGRRYDMGYWVWPLPPAGPLTVYVSWPRYRIGETSAEIDAALLTEAAGRAFDLG